MEFKCYQNTLGTQFAVRDNDFANTAEPITNVCHGILANFEDGDD